MLAKITGMVDYVGAGFVIVEQGGLGYKIILPEQVLFRASGMVTLYLHEVVRDDARELFGFFSTSELELFWKLTSISGVGSRSAQKIVFASSAEEVRRRIMRGDLAFLTAVQGIGKKTAQKIILELAGVFAEEPEVATGDIESVDALMSLGYTRKQAEDALQGIEGESPEVRIKAALKSLAA